MKKYNKILEAIQKGINIALDDFEDEEIQSQKETKPIDQNLTQEELFVLENFVDFNLPSGTLWCKYNIGAIHKSNYSYFQFGKYYAWGELEDKPNFEATNYSWTDYKLAKKESNCLTKYCLNYRMGFNNFKDNLKELLPEDDIAYQTNKRFRIPSKDQFDELCKYVPYEWKTINHINGILFKSKNGNELFFPANGYCFNGDDVCINRYGFYWTQTLNSEDNSEAYAFKLSYNDNQQSGVGLTISDDRCCGMGIRPVYNKNYKI